MSRPRVLLVMHGLSRTGAPMVAQRVFGFLDDELDVRVVAYQGGPLEQPIRQAFPLTVLRPGVPGSGVVGRLKAASFGLSWRGWKPDLVYVNTVAALPTASRLLAVGRHGAPVLLHVHEGPVYMATIEQATPGLIAGMPQRYIAPSDWVAAALADDYDIGPERIATVHSPIGDEWLAGSPEPDSELTHDGKFLIGGAGVPSWVKGTELWLLTAAELLRRPGGRDRYRFVWVGATDREATHQMRAMIGRLQLSSHVELRPHQADVRSIFAALNLYLMSSWEEAAGLVVLEAMALGVPVACFRGSGGPPEEVGEAGVVVEEFAPVDMANAIETLAGDRDRYERIATAGRLRVRGYFSVATVAPKVLEQVDRTIADHHGGRRSTRR